MYYIGWLSGREDQQGASILRGTIEDIESKAKEIANSDAWKQMQPAAYLTITEGAKQKFVSRAKLETGIFGPQSAQEMDDDYESFSELAQYPTAKEWQDLHALVKPIKKSELYPVADICECAAAKADDDKYYTCPIHGTN
jgi:hypothetical protein